MATKSKKSSSKAIKKEKQRILNQNVDEACLPFASRFFSSLIREQEEATVPPPVDDKKSPEQFTPEGDKAEFDKSLDQTANPDKFETKGVSPDVTSDTIKNIKEWSQKLDQFAEFLNDPTTESLHKILSDGDRSGSLLRGVTRKASDSITRIAGEIEKLKEILNTYIITAPKKLRDTEQQTAGWTQY
jgi:hypothetical protein